MGSPLDVSVLVATYNQASTLPEALESVLHQDFPTSRYEVLVIDDGSTDQTTQVLQPFRGRVKALAQPHQGLPAACNEGLKRAQGRYFARVDSDDWVDPAWLRLQTEAMERSPQACGVFPDSIQIKADGTHKRLPVQRENLYSFLACGALFRTEAVRAAGGYRSVYWEEFDLYLRLRRQGLFLHLPRSLYFYRGRPGAMTSVPERRKEGWKELIRLWGVDALREAGSSEELEEVIAEGAVDAQSRV